MSKKLNAKQEQFCLEYMLDFNATQAAIRAGYSEKTANQQGPRMLVNVGVSERIEELKEVLFAEKKAKIFERIKIHESIINSNIYDFMDESAAGIFILKDKDKLTIDQQRSVKGFRIVGNSIVPEFWDKQKSLDQLGKMLGDYEEDNKQKTEHTVNFDMNEAREKLANLLSSKIDND